MLFVLLRLCLFVVGPNEALIVSGTPRRTVEGVQHFRCVRGGRTLCTPSLERVDRLDLSNLVVDVEVRGVATKDGTLRVVAAANVKVAEAEPGLLRAARSFVGADREELQHIARIAVHGALRDGLVALSTAEAVAHPSRVSELVIEGADHDLAKLGMVIDTLAIQRLIPDDRA